MNPLAQMNQAMEYLESMLYDDIDFERLEQIACCSEYHFRRMFSYLSGMTLGEYIRRRRLSLAAVMLGKGIKVIDCAVTFGYDSPDAFRKAFLGIYGVTPSEVKRKGIRLKPFPPMTFQLTIKGGNSMDYRIVHNKGFNIAGFKKRITLQFDGINHQMDSLTDKLTPEIIIKLKSLCDMDPKGILSVSADFSDDYYASPKEGTELYQYTGVATTGPVPEGYDKLSVFESDWAVFTVVGEFPKAVQD
ncbi:MAG: AraC family transcriptional regulator, partial [Clostridiales bacterium]|nr:AraC family transcriptional regulator [Clostridiales bacterium]